MTPTMKDVFREASLLAVLAAGSCASPNNEGNLMDDPVANHPFEVAPSFHTLRVGFSGADAGLMPDDSQRFDAFVQDYIQHGNGAISISAPAGRARAGADRRLAKAHVNVQLGGINAASDHYHGQVTPNLLIVETRLNGAAALEELDKLAEVCDPTTKVIVVGRVNDVELYPELMRRGASEYLVAPLNPLHLIEVISGLYLDPEAAPIGSVVALVGG